jgi:hypothetical protein
MNRSRVVTVVLLLGWAGCAADGGQRGTGVTNLEGNVIAIEGDAAPATALGGIAVTVEGTNLRTETDAEGQFALRGAVGGETALHFERQADGVAGRVSVNAPAGGTTTLRDVTVQSSTGAALPAAIYVDFEGRVVELDCASDRLTCVSAASPDDEDDAYVIVLTDSSVHDDAGRVLTCADFAVGDRMRVEGAYANDGTIGPAKLTRN